MVQTRLRGELDLGAPGIGMALPTSASEPPRSSSGRAAVAAAAAVALLVAAVCVAAGLGAGNALQTTELVSLSYLEPFPPHPQRA